MRDLDSIGIKILNVLQHNGRETNASLALSVGLAPSAVLERVKKLRETGVISHHATVLDRKLAGFSITAFVQVRTSEPLREENVIRSLCSLDQVLEVHDVTGAECFLLKVIARDTDDLHDLIHKHIGKIEGVVSTSTSIALKTCKETVAIPLSIENAKRR
ncbi:MAG: Lrp/AsnC family transcriptional regulator [Phycisphaerales bacterium JB043]